MLDHGRISPSPLNPRKHFDEIGLRDLADSLLAFGMQQPLVVRQHMENSGTAGGVVTYSIVMGERRWRAAALAGMLTVPAIVRTDLDDLKHAELAMEENVRRRDLTAIEEANGYAKLMELGKTQAEIGEGVGVGQSRISNLIRLLELPEDVQQMIEEGALTTGHGIQLARYKDFRALCSFLAGKTVEAKWPVKILEAGLTYATVYDALSKQDQGHPLLVDLSAYQKTRFNWKAVCPQCPFGAFRGRSDRSDGSGFCLKPSHWAELQTEADARTQEAARAEAARQRELAQQKLESAGEAVAGSGPSSPGGSSKSLSHAIGEQAAAQKSVETLKKAGGTLPNVWEVDCQVLATGRPEGCTADCPCAGRAVSRAGEIVDVCLDTRRLESLKRAKAMDENKARRQRFDGLRQEIEAAPDALRGSEAMAMMAWAVLRDAKQDPKRQTKLSHLGGDVFQDVSKLMGEVGYGTRDEDAWATLSRVPLGDLVQLTCEVLLREELHNQQEYKSDRIPKTEFILNKGILSADVPPEPENFSRLEEPADADGTLEARLYPCADCKVEDDGDIYVDANGYDVDKTAGLGDWVCLACQAKRTEAAHADQLLCDGCREPLTEGAFDDAKSRDWFQGEATRMTSGELAVRGQVYCHVCGPQRLDDGSPSIPDNTEGIPDLSPAAFAVGQRVEVTYTQQDVLGNFLHTPTYHPATVVRDDGGAEPVWVKEDDDPMKVKRQRYQIRALSEGASEPGKDDAEDKTPPSLDDNFCRACQIMPLTGNLRLCAQCDPFLADREEAVLAA